jgi:light-regulated signal transduction histidine kinase (bacteriophytochrome)
MKLSVPTKIALIYIFIGGMWIFFSDVLLAALVASPIILTQLQIFKGWIFIIMTAWLLHRLIGHSQQRLQEQEEELRLELEQRVATRTAELENAAAEMKSLYTVSRSLNTQGLSDVLQTVVNSAVESLAADRVLLYVVDLDKKQVIQFVRGGPGIAQTVQVDFDELWEGLTGWVLRENKPVLSSKNQLDSRESLQVRQRNFELNTGDKIVVPIHYHGRMWGTLTAINRLEDRSFSQRDLELLVGMAGQAAIAIESEHLVAEMSQRTRALEDSNKELEAFSYSVSHDLRAPLRTIDGFSRIVLEEFAPELPATAQRYLRLVREGAQRMDRLINDLLDFSHISRHTLTKQAVDMTDIVTEALRELDQERVGRQLKLEMSPLPPCQADPKLLKQVFVNLLSNAFKYTRSCELAQVEIGYQDQMGEQIYFIKDNGVGFDMRYASKLFGVFQRLHPAEAYEGTGVGLALIQRIIHRHGGRIWAEAAPNKGATFYFTLSPASIENGANHDSDS